MSKVILPVRSREYGVGKEMVGSVYMHCRYQALLGDVVETARKYIPPEFEYTVVKYNRKTGAVSFISSPDFDTSSEPIVGDLWTVSADGNAKLRRQLPDPYIYHHKWLMVADDYDGFDVQESIGRSRTWVAIEGLDRKRIGRLGWWRSAQDRGTQDVTRSPTVDRYDVLH